MRWGLCFLIFLIAAPVIAQNFGFQEPFHLVALGSGAAAMGMGGSYVAIADDLSALYWNPAGLSVKPGLRLQIDALYTKGSEMFAVTSNRSGTSQHDYSVDGFQPQSMAVTYQFRRKDMVLGPSFGWSRSSLFLRHYKMDTTATGHMTTNNFVLESDYTSLENLAFDRSGEDIYTLGFSVRNGSRFAFGITWNVLAGETTRTQNIHQTAEGTYVYFLPDQEPVAGPFSWVLDTSEKTEGRYSGNYWNVGFLTSYRRASFGGSVRFQYKRKVSVTSSGSYDFDFSGLVPNSDHRTTGFDPVTVEYNVPVEVSGGIAIFLSSRIRAASSLTLSNYNFNYDPGNADIFPTFRDAETKLVQWRNGMEFFATDSWTLRAGWVLDNQLYRRNSYSYDTPDTPAFYAFSLGAGWKIGKAHVDIAYMHETGVAYFGRRLGGITDHDVESTDASFSHNRFFFTLQVSP